MKASRNVRLRRQIHHPETVGNLTMSRFENVAVLKQAYVRHFVLS